MIRVLIVDDETLTCSKIRRMLARDEEIEIIGQCENGKDAIRVIEQQRPDIIFLDIQMPEFTGFEVLERLKKDIPAVIFVSAYDHYALRAFEFHPLDYLLKPFAQQRFDRAFERAKQQFLTRQIHHAIQELKLKSQDRLIVKFDGRILFVKTDEVDWIEAQGRYVVLHSGNKKYPYRASISSLEVSLDQNKFFRAHRKALIHLESVRELHKLLHGDHLVILKSGDRIRLSRRYYNNLHQMLRKPGQQGISLSQ
jgi:two-component system LytT family response regulator